MKKILWIGLLAGLLMVILAFILNVIFAMIFPGFQEIYKNSEIFITDMASGRGLLFWVYPFALGIALAWLYTKLKVKSALEFAWIYFVVGALPGFLINVGSFNLPVMMIVTWTVMSFLNGWLAGFVFKKMLK